MVRMICAAVVTLAVVVIDLQLAKAYEAPWCAMVETGIGSMHWDCQYHSFEDCYRRGNILAGNRGFCNPKSVQRRQRHRTQALSETPRAHPRSSGATGHVVNVRFWPFWTLCPSDRGPLEQFCAEIL